jgi:hypothetical protein
LRARLRPSDGAVAATRQSLRHRFSLDTRFCRSPIGRLLYFNQGHNTNFRISGISPGKGVKILDPEFGIVSPN